jgi:hypothetical protein
MQAQAIKLEKMRVGSVAQTDFFDLIKPSGDGTACLTTLKKSWLDWQILKPKKLDINNALITFI